MNYYPHHIGDYLRDTSHLTATEDGIYRRMLDVYYASEKPLPIDPAWVAKLVRAHTEEERTAVGELLRQFFVKYEDGWRNKRADTEIRLMKKRLKAWKDNGKKGGRPKTNGFHAANPAVTSTANPIQSSQTPNTKHQNQRNKNTVGQKPDALQVLQFLNEKTGRNYKPVPANLELILARLKEGASPDDLRAVIAKKCREWAGDEKMDEFLRPATLFNRTKFAQYQGELGAPEPKREVAL